MFVNDSWSTWDPDPERAYSEHDADVQPYASMTREQVMDAMGAARGGQEWEFLREFLIDKCSGEELREDRFQAMLVQYLKLDPDEAFFLFEVAGPATRLIPVSRSTADRPSALLRTGIITTSVGGDALSPPAGVGELSAPTE